MLFLFYHREDVCIVNEIIEANFIPFRTEDGVEVVDSRNVAMIIGKDHFNLLQDIKRYKKHYDILKQKAEEAMKAQESNPTEKPPTEVNLQFGNYNILNLQFVDFFIPATYVDNKGETRKHYLITKKGCEFIANKLTGVKGTWFTMEYINAFHKMQEELSKPDGYVTIDELAKLYSGDRGRALGRNRAFEILRMTKHLMSNGMHKNVPYQEHIDNGHMLYVTSHKATEFGVKSFNLVLIPEQFVDYFFNVFDKYYYLQCKVPTFKPIKLF